ncbi:hypothetical protein R70723_16360 [Paenibacillus sp. FSL R7-0273]|uniref:dienelactone hydrolase family protein n=1 Tax=Paenibacillus sp. FSL R7-0273 TaxID=1536772 RepID=UPI0004F5FA75|nr:alpha/beta hydrolase family protein [Paenibacillus sp. FSL R7-0273]AIQ47286.1 hypothetical protein R70723_16360 [Paenibacillus sp. FSL R7-0273]OMF91602.1 hypothetical protein BK144_15550 [Paenibacillus sp. FSL R7-0273]
MDFTTDAYIKALYQRTEAVRNNRDLCLTRDEQREWLMGRLKQALGEFPEASAPLNPVLLERIAYKDFILERISYSTEEALHVPVIVLVPKTGSGPWPAVLACHGHGNGQLDAAGLNSDYRELEEPGIHNRFAVQLVKQGMIVVIPEILGFGVRRVAEEMKNGSSPSSCSTLVSQLMLFGRTLAGMRVYEAMRAVDYLSMRKDSDSSRIGIFGFSGGSLIAAYAAALDERIKAAVLCGWTNTFAGSILAMHHCIDNYLPGILQAAEKPELVGLIAPRALFIESGVHDPIFPVQHVHSAITSLEQIYSARDAASRLSYDLHPGSHEIYGKLSVPWLYRMLTNEAVNQG